MKKRTLTVLLSAALLLTAAIYSKDMHENYRCSYLLLTSQFEADKELYSVHQNIETEDPQENLNNIEKVINSFNRLNIGADKELASLVFSNINELHEVEQHIISKTGTLQEVDNVACHSLSTLAWIQFQMYEKLALEKDAKKAELALTAIKKNLNDLNHFDHSTEDYSSVYGLQKDIDILIQKLHEGDFSKKEQESVKNGLLAII